MSTTTELISSANDLLASHSALLARVRDVQRAHRALLPPHQLLSLPDIASPSPDPSPPSSPVLKVIPKVARADLPPAKRARVARYANYVPEEETIRNDYSQRYVDGGEWPQNWVLGAEPEHRFEEYPKQQRLLSLKKAAVQAHSLPPLYLPLSSLPALSANKFDTILIDPPFSSSFTWDSLQALPIPALSADPSFVFLWVGSGAGEGLERGREIMAKWGFRRCEDVVWVKTNRTAARGPGTDPPTTSLLTRTKQHCLIGIRGTVRRSTDGWLVHCNVDTDVLIWEGDPLDPTRKPPEMYTLVENFCLGTRRLELFGRARSSLRRGWVTVLVDGDEARVRAEMAPDVEGAEGAGLWEREGWEAGIRELAQMGAGGGGAEGGVPRPVVPSTPEIDALRPKSPVRGGTANHHQNQSQQHQGQGQHFQMQGGMNPMGMNMGIGMGNMNMNMPMPMMGMGRGMGMNMNNMNMGMNNMGIGIGMGRGGFNPNQMNMNPAMMAMQNQMMMPGMMPGGMEGMGMGMGGGMGMGAWPMGMMGMQNMQGQGQQGGFGYGPQGQGQGPDGMWDASGAGAEGIMWQQQQGQGQGQGQYESY